MGYKQGLVFNEEKPNGIILNIANIKALLFICLKHT